MIVLHGAGSCGANHGAFVRAAAARGFSAEAPDLPGHGSLRQEPLADAVEWARGRCGPGTALRGSSLGAWIALHVAALERGVAAVVALAPTHEGLMRERFGEWDATIDRERFARALAARDLFSAVGRIHAPVLYVLARDDERIPLADVERLHDLTPSSQLVVLDSGGHRGPSHDPAVHELTLDWLTGVLA